MGRTGLRGTAQHHRHCQTQRSSCLHSIGGTDGNAGASIFTISYTVSNSIAFIVLLGTTLFASFRFLRNVSLF
jgi:hypothetical protein